MSHRNLKITAELTETNGYCFLPEEMSNKHINIEMVFKNYTKLQWQEFQQEWKMSNFQWIILAKVTILFCNEVHAQ